MLTLQFLDLYPTFPVRVHDQKYNFNRRLKSKLTGLWLAESKGCLSYTAMLATAEQNLHGIYPSRKEKPKNVKVASKKLI